MKKIFINILFIGFTATISAQDIVTNAENSEYKFTKVAQLENTPVLSQGHTGTCWSFSSLSFFESELIRKGNKAPAILSQMFISRKGYKRAVVKGAKSKEYTNINPQEIKLKK